MTCGFPLDLMRDYSARGGLMRLADGPDECARAVREQLRRSAKLIKVCASGGVLSEVDDPVHCCHGAGGRGPRSARWRLPP